MIESVALIPAAGIGRRFGGEVHKTFVSYQGRPLLWHTLDQLSQVPEISEMVVALHCQDLALWSSLEGLSQAQKSWKPLTLVEGGATRTESVYCAFKKVCETRSDVAFMVCIHDAARPFVSASLVTQVLEAAWRTGAAGCALAVTDTIKQIQPGGALKTLSREALRALQTPQVIRGDLLQKAFENWQLKNCPAMTDDLQLLEDQSLEIPLIEGDPQNIKVTYNHDLSPKSMVK